MKVSEARIDYGREPLDILFKPQQGEECNGNRYDVLYGHINLVKELEPTGVRVIIPRGNLFGRQNVEEYSSKKRRQVECAFKDRGIIYLQENPIIACGIHNGHDMMVAIVDGHHRARFSGEFHIYNLPCLVCSPGELTTVLNKYNREKITEDFLIKTMTREVSAALESFSRKRMPDRKFPLVVPNVLHIGKLPELFPAF